MSFQAKIKTWMENTFGSNKTYENPDNPHHSSTRILRFMEEAIELFQAEGLGRAKFEEVSTYVWDRPHGQINQEIGGVMVTLTAYCISKNLDILSEAWREFYRIDTDEMREKIRNKQAEKPNGLPSPECGVKLYTAFKTNGAVVGNTRLFNPKMNQLIEISGEIWTIIEVSGVGNYITVK